MCYLVYCIDKLFRVDFMAKLEGEEYRKPSIYLRER